MSEIEEAVAAIWNSEFDKPNQALQKVEERINRTHGDRAARLEVEMALARLLEGDASRAAKHFACKKLWMMGTDASVPGLERLLTGGDALLVEAACYAIGSRQSEAASASLRRAVAKNRGPALVAIVNLVGDRRDAAAVKLLTPLIGAADRQLAEAAMAALGKIASSEAVAALNVMGGEPASHALLQAAQELNRRGDRTGAARIYRKLKDKGQSAVIRRAAQAARDLS